MSVFHHTLRQNQPEQPAPLLATKNGLLPQFGLLHDYLPLTSKAVHLHTFYTMTFQVPHYSTSFSAAFLGPARLSLSSISGPYRFPLKISIVVISIQAAETTLSRFYFLCTAVYDVYNRRGAFKSQLLITSVCAFSFVASFSKLASHLELPKSGFSSSSSTVPQSVKNRLLISALTIENGFSCTTWSAKPMSILL